MWCWDRIRQWWTGRAEMSSHDSWTGHGGHDGWLDEMSRRHRDEELNRLQEDNRRWAEDDRHDDWHRHHDSWSQHDGSSGTGTHDWPSPSSSWDSHGQ